MSRIIKHDFDQIPDSFCGCYGLKDGGACSCDMQDHCAQTRIKQRELREQK